MLYFTVYEATGKQRMRRRVRFGYHNVRSIDDKAREFFFGKHNNIGYKQVREKNQEAVLLVFSLSASHLNIDVSQKTVEIALHSGYPRRSNT